MGSLGLALRGILVEPHDIDLMTDRNGSYEIERILSEFVTDEVHLRTSDKIQSHFGALEIDGIRIEIMGDFLLRRSDGSWDDPPDIQVLRRIVRVEEMQVPVLSLEWECQCYSKLGRSDRVEAINELLKDEQPDG